MNSLTYAIILGLVFFSGIFLFAYFATPHKVFKKGMRQLRNMKVLNLKRNKTVTIPNQNASSRTPVSQNNDQREVRVYVYEY